MPAKNPPKSRARTPTRGRSKSVGRSPNRKRSRTPTRSRSRSRSLARSTPYTKRRPSPASESRILSRRSSDSSRSSSPKPLSRSAKVVLSRLEKGPKASTTIRETIPTRVSQRLLNTELLKTSSVHIRTPSSIFRCESYCDKVGRFFRETICPSWFLALFGILSLFPFVCWLNLFIFAPASSQKVGSEIKVLNSIWGPAIDFAGVLWPTNIYQYFNVACHLFILTYLLLNFLIARYVPIKFPPGSSDYRRPEYRSNGIFALLFFGALYAFAQFHPMVPAYARPTVLLPKYWFSLMIAAGKFSALLSVITYFASKNIPRSQVCPEGNTGNFFVDFWVGRIIKPRWFNLDWKMVATRPGVIAMLLVETTYLLAQWERSGRVSPALALLVVMHTIWLSDIILFEHTMQFTFEQRYEGFGYYAIGGMLLLPFIYSIPASYLSLKPDFMRLTTIKGEPDYMRYALLTVAMIVFLLGYWIYRGANNQKDRFRRQPNHPSFVDCDKISGPHSQRLLAGGWWGLVRHPNYLGDLMMAYSMGLIAGFQSIIPWMYPILLTALLCHRIWRTEYHCQEKYGLSMTMYKKLVPSKLIPKIY